VDHVTGKTTQPVTTMQIYKGAIPFLLLQLTMVGVLIAFPALVTGSLDKQVQVDMKAVGEQMLQELNQTEGSDFNAAPPLPGLEPPAANTGSAQRQAATSCPPPRAVQRPRAVRTTP
jgi:TRAP-type mannitol/chloroaromatic compound transport system, large permease component